MKKFYLLFLIGNIYIALGQSPIILTNSNMPNANDTLRYTNVQVSSIGNYVQTGANYNWDFSNVISTTSGRRDFKSALNTPYAFYFLSLNEYGEKVADTLVGGTGTISITNYYNFYKKQSTPVNAFTADGVGMSINNIPVASYYSDKDELYNFPMTYPKYDSTTFKFSTLTTSLIPIKYSKQGYRVTKVDGWGTVKTPYGINNCLRLITTQYSIDTISVNLPIPGLPPIKFGTPNNQRSYQWISTTSKIPFMEVTGNLLNNNFTVTQIRYRGVDTSKHLPPPPPPPNLVGLNEVQDISAFATYPNPVKDKVWLNGSIQMPNKVEIFDINGKLIAIQNLEQYNLVAYISTDQLPQGLYIIKINTNQKPLIFKIIKE